MFNNIFFTNKTTFMIWEMSSSKLLLAVNELQQSNMRASKHNGIREGEKNLGGFI